MVSHIEDPMKIYITFLLAVSLVSGSEAQSFARVSKKIDECGQLNKSSWKGETFDDLRMKLRKQGLLKFIDFKDTLFILQTYSIESGAYSCRLWSRKGKLSFRYLAREFTILVNDNFPDEVVGLVTNWTSSSLLRLSQMDDQKLDAEWIKAIIVTCKRRKVEIKCHSFRAP
jgi:hypothetical protein